MYVGRQIRTRTLHIIASMAKTLPSNAEIADQFDLLADFLELEGSDQFRPLAYRRAAQRMRETGGSIAQLAVEGKAKQLSGIGKTIEEKIVQIVEDGEIEALAKRKERIPADVVEFMHLPGLGPKTARRIWKELDVSTIEGLKQAAESEQLRTLTGLGPKTEENVLRALATPRKEIEKKPLLGRALPAVRAVVSVLREHPAADQVSEAGSVRRLKEQVRDLDIIATASDPAALTEYFTQLPGSRRSSRRETRRRRSSRTRACGSTSASFRPSRTETCSSTSRAPRRTTSPSARKPSARSSRSPSTASRTRSPARSSPTRPKRPCTSGSATPGSRPSCERTWASSRPRAKVASRSSSS